MLRERQTLCVTTMADLRDRDGRARGGDLPAPDADPTDTMHAEDTAAPRPAWILRALGAVTALVSLWFAMAFLGGLPGSAVEWLALALLGAFAYSLGFTVALFVGHLLTRAIRA